MTRVLIIYGVTLLLTAPAVAMSGNEAYQGCQAVAHNDHTKRSLDLIYGYCVGVIETLIVTTPTICLPRQGYITVNQLAAVVVRSMDTQPENRHLDFKAIATVALKQAWPCKKPK
jgi:hypothetical protein